MTRATLEEIAELLGDDVDESIAERIAAVDASLDEIGEAIDDLDHERRYGESRQPSSYRVEEVKSILEEVPASAAGEVDRDDTEDDEHEGLTIVGPDELGGEPS